MSITSTLLFRILAVVISAILTTLCAAPALALGWFGTTLDGNPCSGRGQGFGPYDFFDVNDPSDAAYQEGRWWEARTVHAQPGIAAMESKPLSQAAYNRAAEEFDYLLRAYPNHPEILHAMVMLELKRRSSENQLKTWGTPPECYLARAAAFRPEQAHIPQLHAFYLQRLGRIDQALEWYERALELAPSSSEIHYNMGLAFIDKGNYESAAYHAEKAYEQGFPLPGLRNKLEALGVAIHAAAEAPAESSPR